MLPDLLAFVSRQYGFESARLLQRFAANGRREVHLLQTDRGKMVLKLTDPHRPEEVVKSDTAILEYVAGYDFPAPRLLRSAEDALYLAYEDRFLYVYEYLEGGLPAPSAKTLSACGALLARLHSLPLHASARASQYRPAAILAELNEYLAETPAQTEQQRMADDLRERIAAMPDFTALPTGLIHTDPYYGNLLQAPAGELFLIDWEDAGVAYPLLDVGYIGFLTTFLPNDRALLGLSGAEPVTWRPDWAQAFLDGYQALRPLSPLERELFPAALRVNFLAYIWEWNQKRIIPENYARMKILEDWRPLWR